MPKKTLSLATTHEPCCLKDSPVSEADEGSRVTYPGLWLSDIAGIKDLPEEGTATIKFRRTRRSVTEREEKGETKVNEEVALDITEITFDASEDDSEDEGADNDSLEDLLDAHLSSKS